MQLSSDSCTSKIEVIASNDCALSLVSSASIATTASKKTGKGDISSTENIGSKEDAVTLSSRIPVAQATQLQSISDESKGKDKVEHTDEQSSDGWETVEPKGGRSRRNGSKSTEKQSNTPLSPNGRKNKNKAKSRQRTKQKAKEKEVRDIPKRSVETLEEGIVKRGSNTIKALMEERNKRPSSDNKKTEATKITSTKSSLADQNTAQTIPESLSGVSSLPVQTLYGLGNHNSASSSVASSLEAPHATRHKPHIHHDSCKEDDVGYHLLKVCERLSIDMNTFMRRRASALAVRRRERGALLAALQDTVQVCYLILSIVYFCVEITNIFSILLT